MKEGPELNYVCKYVRLFPGLVLKTVTSKPGGNYIISDRDIKEMGPVMPDQST
jgi:hypothetical protein